MRRVALNYLALTAAFLGAIWGFMYGGRVGGVVCTALAVVSLVAWRRGRANREGERSLGFLKMLRAVFGLRAAASDTASGLGGALFGELLVPYVAAGVVSTAAAFAIGLDGPLAVIASLLGVGALAGMQLGLIKAGSGAIGSLVRHARDTGGLGLVADPERKRELVRRSGSVAAVYLVLTLLAALSLPDDGVANPLWSLFLLLMILLLPVLAVRNNLFYRAAERPREAQLVLVGLGIEVLVAALLFSGISAEGGSEFSPFVDAVLAYFAGSMLNPVRWHTAGKRGSANALWAT